MIGELSYKSMLKKPTVLNEIWYFSEYNEVW